MSEMNRNEVKELVEEYERMESYKQTFLEKRKSVDEKYSKVYNEYLKTTRKINELKKHMAPLEEGIAGYERLKFQNNSRHNFCEQIENPLKQIEEIKGNIKNKTKQLMEDISNLFEEIQSLPEYYIRENLTKTIEESEKDYKEMLELKKVYEIKLEKLKQKYKYSDVEFDTPPNLEIVVKQIKEKTIKEFGDAEKILRRKKDIENHVAVLKKKNSEIKGKI